MQIRHKLILLLGIPLFCQLGSTSWLNYSHARLDALVLQESKAKRVIALVVQIREKIEQTFLRLAIKRVIGHDAETASRERELLKQNFASLRDLIGDNPKARLVLEKSETDCEMFVVTWLELMYGFKPGQEENFFSQFLGHEDFGDELEFRFRSVNRDIDDLLAMYSPIAKELQPRESKAREELRQIMIGTMVFNVLLVLGMASLINANTVSRLKILMSNMRVFSKGLIPTEKLSGRDELAELDGAFSAMASERNRLEDIRKSLRAMVSHDLRSPLTSMSLRLEMMLGDDASSLSQSTHQNLQRLLNETHRLKRLANTLLDVERMQDGNLELRLQEVRIEELLLTAVGAVQSQAMNKQVIIDSASPEEARCVCDTDSTIQVLINLLSNSIKFAPPGSTIKLLASSGASGASRFEVHDQGPGIPRDKVDRLFAKFSQLDQPDDVKELGSGLGLYICKMLVAAHKGVIGYLPGELSGSCFWFELPQPDPIIDHDLVAAGEDL